DHLQKGPPMKFWIARVLATLVLGAGTAYAAPHVSLLGFDHGGGRCGDVGEHSHPVGDHSKPCHEPHGCAIGHGGPVGDRSKPCPHPHGCAVGNPRFRHDESKHCPKPHKHDKHEHEGHSD